MLSKTISLLLVPFLFFFSFLLYQSLPLVLESKSWTCLWMQIHLFDIDIPGKITFMESKTLTAGETPTIVDTGKACLEI